MVSNDLTIYSVYAHEWWQPDQPRFRSLHRLTPFRLGLIAKMYGSVVGRDVVDLGCGGGLLAIPLLDRGARVTGIDQSEASIIAAQTAAGGRGRFLVGDVRAVPLPAGCADLVVLADVLDHVPEYRVAIAEAARLLRPGGAVFLGTINRTWLSWLLAIVLGEGLRLIPPGTHAFSLFLTPEEITAAAHEAGLAHEVTVGETPAVCSTVRRWAISLRESSSTAVAYSMVLRKVA